MLTRRRDAEAPAPRFDVSSAGQEMYPEERNQDGTARHSKLCRATPGRRDWQCRCCVELMLERRPVLGWERDYFMRKLGTA